MRSGGGCGARATPSPAAISAFAELVASIKVDGAGGDQASRVVRMQLVGINNTQIEFPESTHKRVYEIGRELFANAHVRRNFTFHEVVERLHTAASTAAGAREVHPAEQQLHAAYAQIGKDPAPIRMPFRLAPFLHFAEEAVTIGDVTLYRAVRKS